MKRQELDQMRQKSKEELLKDAAALQRELVDLKLKRQQAHTNNVRLMGQTRKKLAQILTLVATKE